MNGATGGVGVVGPGRVGTVLAGMLQERGEEIRAVVGRGRRAMERFVDRFPTARDDGVEGLADCELILISTPDDSLEEVATALAVADVVGDGDRVVHVSGRHGLAPLRRAALTGARVAACHPAQTVPGPQTPGETLEGAAWAVTAAPADRGWSHDLVRRLGGVPHDVAEADRLLYHAGLAVGSNAVGAAVAVARRLLSAAGVADPASFLDRLVEASTRNVLADGAAAITGPVRRGDVGTVRAHLEALDADVPGLADAYRHLTAAIVSQVAPELDPADLAQLEEALRPIDRGAR